MYPGQGREDVHGQGSHHQGTGSPPPSGPEVTKSDEMAVLLILLVLAVLGLLCQLQAESNSEAGVQARAIPPHSPGPREACLGRVGLSWTTGGISGQGSLLLDHGRHIWAG